MKKETQKVVQEENSSKQEESNKSREATYSHLRKSKVESLTEEKTSTGNRSIVLDNVANKVTKETQNHRFINLSSRNIDMKRVEQSKELKEVLFSPPLAPKFFKAESRKSRRISESNKSSNEILGLPNYNNYDNIVKFTDYIKRVFVASNTTRSTKDINYTTSNNHLNDILHDTPSNKVKEKKDKVDELRLSNSKAKGEDDFSAACENSNNRNTMSKGYYTTVNIEPKMLHKHNPVIKKTTNRVPLKGFRITKRQLKVQESTSECNVINDFPNVEKENEDINDKLQIQEGEKINLFPLLKISGFVFRNSLAVPDIFIFV